MTALSKIYHNTESVEAAVVDELAEKIMPALKAEIDAAAERIVRQFDTRMTSPFAVDAAKEAIIHKLAEFVTLSSIDEDDFDLVQPAQMTATHLRFWLGKP